MPSITVPIVFAKKESVIWRSDWAVKLKKQRLTRDYAAALSISDFLDTVNFFRVDGCRDTGSAWGGDKTDFRSVSIQVFAKSPCVREKHILSTFPGWDYVQRTAFIPLDRIMRDAGPMALVVGLCAALDVSSEPNTKTGSMNRRTSGKQMEANPGSRHRSYVQKSLLSIEVRTLIVFSIHFLFCNYHHEDSWQNVVNFHARLLSTPPILSVVLISTATLESVSL